MQEGGGIWGDVLGRLALVVDAVQAQGFAEPTFWMGLVAFGFLDTTVLAGLFTSYFILWIYTLEYRYGDIL